MTFAVKLINPGTDLWLIHPWFCWIGKTRGWGSMGTGLDGNKTGQEVISVMHYFYPSVLTYKLYKMYISQYKLEILSALVY